MGLIKTQKSPLSSSARYYRRQARRLVLGPDDDLPKPRPTKHDRFTLWKVGRPLKYQN